MSRAKRVRKARNAARRARYRDNRFDVARAHLAETTERAQFRRELNASDAPEALKTVLGMLADPIGYVVETMQKAIREVCPHCLGNNISAHLQATVTERGEVRRCWQCGGEYRYGMRVWPEPPGVIQPRVDSPLTNSKDNP